jgi:alpha-1,6-mannosyltransferase
LRSWLGALGLVLVLAGLLLIVVDAAAAPTDYVPASAGGWPDWLSGPLRGIGSELHGGGFEALMLVMCAGYLLVLAGARTLPISVLAGAIVLAHVLLLLGPPLISQDVFGYLAFARMGALHGLDPYTRVAAEAASDPVFAFVGWPFKHSPYGPLFTLASYGAAPLGAAGGLWAMKSLAVLASLAAIALSAAAAARLGRSASQAAAFIGLNPVLLVLAVGGAHNDTLLIMLLSLALFLTAGANPRFRAGAWALAVAVGVKVTAGLALPFLVLAPAERARRLAVALAAILGLIVVAALGVIGFGPHALGFLGAVGEQQRLIATHSIPAETARLFSLDGTPGWWRGLFGAGFVVVLLGNLWRGARGADWRDAAGWSTLALIASTAWLLPWYAIWALPLAAVSGNRRLRAAVLLACAYAILIHLPLADPLLSPRG